MSKTKSSDIPHYELLYIISNKFTEDEVKPIAEKINKIITDAGAAITLSEEWGKKKLAFPIKNFSFGYYNLAEFNCSGASMESINRSLSMSKEILRHLIISKPVKSEIKIREEREISKKIASKAAEQQKKFEEEKTKGKVDLKELDEKLDKILDTDDLL